MPRLPSLQISTLNDVRSFIRMLVTLLNADWCWRGAFDVADPDRPSEGDVWIRTDLCELRIRVAERTYSIIMTEMES